MASETDSPREELLAPVGGTIIGIADVPDPVFSGKMVGDGFGVSEPSTGDVLAPVSGTVTMAADTGHALGFKTDSGLEVLVHLGVDTVELEGRPFAMEVSKGDAVQAGQRIGRMDVEAITEAGKDPTAIVVMPNTAKKVESVQVRAGHTEAGQPAVDVALKEPGTETGAVPAGDPEPGHARQPQVENTAAPADATEAESEERPGDLTGYDALAWDILDNIGGKANVRSVTHCITRVRFYLKDQGKADDEVVADLDGVIDVVRAGGQYQVVIGPAVEDVYDAVVKQLGTDKAAASEQDAAEEAERPDTAWGWVKYGFSSLIGVITGSMIPVIGLLAAAGILKGILSLLTQFDVVDESSQTFTIISAMGDAVFYFLPIFVGFTAARRLGSDPIIVSIVGGVLAYPTLVEMAAGEGQRSLLGMSLNAEFFGLPFHMASYSYSIFPMIVAAWFASIVEPWLKKIIPTVLRMIFVPLFEVVIVSLAVMVVLGPAVMFVSEGIASALMWVYDMSPTISGLIIGGFYQCLVIFGLHWAVIPIVTDQVSGPDGQSPINAIISATMVAQGGAVLAVFVKSKLPKIKELAGPAAISAFCGITEPAMYGVNLKYTRVFVMASIGGAAGGLLTGMFGVTMYAFTGSLVGFPSFITPGVGADGNLVGYLIASATALVVAFILTYFFGFRDADADTAREVKKVRLGRRDPVQK
ncbi:PTS beta-glucoside transporter subunit IIABC [Rothia kristinae]|uniref:PTS beta-glucoside transporter subunit IIABC n=1 Tax=Rothia kristinae TaxID=37923 RepID=A0A199PUJ9_9MICC|nr:glucose PTS transporter subunit IIA [Rothia kristinae]OAX52532.1 PTS beta-glucoside transporter subunit IIABC [Rothia kristinae]OAX64827.1 PTS beta-glucoside transporter subunit IIABC [Rothia kristinae]